MKAALKMNRSFIRKLALKLRRLRHEEHYDQGVWGEKTSCGTAACLAGHAVLLAAGKLQFGWEADTAFTCSVPSLSKRPLEVFTAGRKLMGLSLGQARRLFGGGALWPGEYAERFEAAREGSGERPSRVAAEMLGAIADGKVKL